MPTDEIPDPQGPQTYHCPFCSLKVVVRRTQLVGERNDRILYVGHVKPICPGFAALEDPAEYIDDARGGAVHQANDG